MKTTSIALLAAAALLAACGESSAPAAPSPGRPALTVAAIAPQVFDWPRVLAASGSVVAWQEAVIGPEISNYRITELLVDVGDTVKKGQVLARIADDTVASEHAEMKAAVAELEASAAEARGNAARAKELKDKGFYSTQLQVQYQTAEHTASARLAAARARLQAAALKLEKTRVQAPDDGVISARDATVGSLTQPGQEMFRLIRGGRLEWRAEVPSADLGKVAPGAVATLTGPDGVRVTGKVRSVAPSVDPQTRSGLVYVDLPTSGSVRAGMFARGDFELGRAPALTLPESAVVLREGFAYVFRFEGDGDTRRVQQAKVVLGRRSGERVEIVSGLDAGTAVVEKGAGFLADGDLVKVVAGAAR